MNRGFRGASPLVLLAALVVSPNPAPAQQEMIIYRCVDASGAVTLQNDVPCPKGSRQTTRKVGDLPGLPTTPPPAPAAPAASPAPSAPVAATRPDVIPPPRPAEPVPPPPLFQCRTWDERDYLGETAAPPATCVPLETVGIDGSPALAAGSACEMRQDACIAIAPEQLCTAWKKRVDEAEFRWKIGGSRDDARKLDYERVARIYLGSTCVR
jgi:hypothetical protein